MILIKNNRKESILLVFVLLSMQLMSQTFIIKYKNFNESSDGNLKELIEKWNPNNTEANRILYYTNGTSLFKSIKKSESIKDIENSNENTMALSRNVIPSVYKNQNRNEQMIDFKDFFNSSEEEMNQNIILSSSLTKFDWKLHNDSQKIGEYNCKMATTVDTNGQKIVAWYTNDIPINDGPNHFWGLPGLIIQLQEGNSSLYALTSIYESKEETEIKKFQGNIMNKDTFDAYVKEFLKPKTYTRPDGTVVRISGSRN